MGSGSHLGRTLRQPTGVAFSRQPGSKMPHMAIIRAIIVDDDPFTAAQLRGQLDTIAATIDLVAECTDVPSGLAAIISHRPDLVFLDVQMPGMDGFQLLDQLQHRDFGIIFVTSFDQYAIRAIRYSALDYLLKPVKADELRQALDRFVLQGSIGTGRIDHLVAQRRAKEPHESIVIVTRHGDRHLRTKEILRCEADSNYTVFHLHNGERLVASYTMASYEEFLAENEFLRIHRRHMVNVKFVTSMERDGRVVLRDGTSLEVSRRRSTEVFAQWERLKTAR